MAVCDAVLVMGFVWYDVGELMVEGVCYGFV